MVFKQFQREWTFKEGGLRLKRLTFTFPDWKSDGFSDPVPEAARPRRHARVHLRRDQERHEGLGQGHHQQGLQVRGHLCINSEGLENYRDDRKKQNYHEGNDDD